MCTLHMNCIVNEGVLCAHCIWTVLLMKEYYLHMECIVNLGVWPDKTTTGLV